MLRKIADHAAVAGGDAPSLAPSELLSAVESRPPESERPVTGRPVMTSADVIAVSAAADALSVPAQPATRASVFPRGGSATYVANGS
jgi:hypothetical protein